jgi:hypothetical protein
LRVEALAFEQKSKRIPHSRIIVYDENHRFFLPALPGDFRRVVFRAP